MNIYEMYKECVDCVWTNLAEYMNVVISVRNYNTTLMHCELQRLQDVLREFLFRKNGNMQIIKCLK